MATNKQLSRRAFLGLMAGGIGLLATGCEKAVTMSASVVEPGHYLFECRGDSTTDSATITVAQGDELKVEFEVTEGTVNLLVSMEGEAPLYKGDRIDSGLFTLVPEKPGDYIVSIDAKRATGKVEVTLVPNPVSA